MVGACVYEMEEEGSWCQINIMELDNRASASIIPQASERAGGDAENTS